MTRTQKLAARLIRGVYMDRARVMKRLGRNTDVRNLVHAARALNRKIYAL